MGAIGFIIDRFRVGIPTCSQLGMSCVSGGPLTPSLVLSSQPQPATPTAAEIDRAEESAQLAVGLIRRCVDTIRSVDAFAPVPCAALSTIRGNPGRRFAPERTNTSPLALEDVRLIPLLRESNLIDDVTSVCGVGGDGGLGEQNVSVDDATSSSLGERDRREVVNAICIPLLTLLSQCYAILDLVSQTSPTDTGDTMDQTQPPRRRGEQKPRPPKGLLSIADYTDCACMLEFLVCTSILPNLEGNGAILPCPQDRVKFLPKSLSGRLHRRSLLWANAVQMHSPSKRTDKSACRDKMNELRQSSKTIGCVIALDRFRPMLLPRHAADILAALFQSDRYQEMVVPSRSPIEAPTSMLSDSHTAMLNIFLGRGPRGVQVAIGSQETCIQPVDPHTRARSYQTLLSGGTKTPQWLRRRVGSLLNNLAATNLRCVIDVFVVAASSMPTDDISSASARLGKVLSSVPSPSALEVKAIAANPGRSTNAHRYYQRLFQQLALLLDIASASNMAASKKEEKVDVSIHCDPRVVSGVLTVWAVIDNLPHHILERFALPMLANGLIPLRSIGIGRNSVEIGTKQPPLRISVRRILSLFSFAPKAAMGLGKIYHLLLLPLRVNTSMSGIAEPNDELGNVTVIGQIVRVVAAGEDNIVESSRIIQDALLALQMVVHGMSNGVTTVSVAGLTGQEITKALSLALVESVCINAMDIAGIRYKQVLDDGNQDVVLDSLENAVELEGLAREMGSRAKIVVVDLVAKLFESNEQTGGKDTIGSRQVSDLPSILFCLLLLIYFGSTEPNRVRSDKQGEIHTLQLLPAFLRRNLDRAKLAAMSMLPMCCEFCSPENLILGQASTTSEDSADTFGVLTMIQLVVTSVANRKQAKFLEHMEEYGERSGNIEKINNAHRGHCGAASTKLIDYAGCDLSMNCSGVYALGSENAGRGDTEHGPEKGCILKHPSNDEDETLLSIGSIVVSLLVALLELGEERRLPKEEEILTSLLPGLEVLSSPGNRRADAGDTTSRLESEIAEMTSHAVALIHSRGSIQSDKGRSRLPSAPSVTIQEAIHQAEHDLRSDQPPIRARGVVSLRHVAQSFAQGFNNNSTSDVSSVVKPLIVEIDGNGQSGGHNDLSASNILEQLMRLCLETLEDSESYVYLAAIQTLVAIADANAATVIPVLGRSVSLGVANFAFDGFSSPTSAPHHVTLSPLQRIKATEALLFAVRRRGEGIFALGNELLEMMLFGCNVQSRSKPENDSLDSASASTIQAKTEAFFMGERADNERNESDYIDIYTDNEERRLRINTGGPIFNAEEDDVVRAGCVSIVAELVAALPPVGLVRYCPALMKLGKQVLRLDNSRPMRRAAALLCREVYSVIVREFDDAKDENDSFLSFATAVVSCDEETLRATLERCLSANDLDLVGGGPGNDTSTHAAVAVQGKVRLADPATMARCQEALEIRSSIDDVGILTAARLLAVSKTNQDKVDPATRAIIRRLQQTKKRNDGGHFSYRDSVQTKQGGGFL